MHTGFSFASIINTYCFVLFICYHGAVHFALICEFIVFCIVRHCSPNVAMSQLHILTKDHSLYVRIKVGIHN